MARLGRAAWHYLCLRFLPHVAQTRMDYTKLSTERLAELYCAGSDDAVHALCARCRVRLMEYFMGAGRPYLSKLRHERLMELYYAGSNEAFDALYVHLRRGLTDWLKGTSPIRWLPLPLREQAAEDAADLAIFSLCRTADKQTYDPGQPLMPYHHKIARNAAIEQWRREKRAANDVALDKVGPVADQAMRTPPEILEQEELEGRVEECLGKLPPKDRDLIAQRYFEGRPQRDIALDLGIDESGVSVKLKKARQRLRKCVEARLRSTKP